MEIIDHNSFFRGRGHIFEHILLQIGYRSLELMINMGEFNEVNEYLNQNCNEMDLIDLQFT